MGDTFDTGIAEETRPLSRNGKTAAPRRRASGPRPRQR
jgi:hypothetical protein